MSVRNYLYLILLVLLTGCITNPRERTDMAPSREAVFENFVGEYEVFQKEDSPYTKNIAYIEITTNLSASPALIFYTKEKKVINISFSSFIYCHGSLLELNPSLGCNLIDNISARAGFTIRHYKQETEISPSIFDKIKVKDAYQISVQHSPAQYYFLVKKIGPSKFNRKDALESNSVRPCMLDFTGCRYAM